MPCFDTRKRQDCGLTENRTGVRGRTKVVIGANDPALRAGIRMALTTDEIRVCGEVSSVEELIAAVDRHKPDACLIDVDLHGGGLLAIPGIAALRPTTAVIVMTEDQSDVQFLEAMRAGATGYLPNAIAPAALSKVVHAVLNGEPAIPRALVPVLIKEYRERPNRRYLAISGGSDIDLTSREWDVLSCLRDGLSTREAAERLLISEVTVRRHVGGIVKKLHVDTRADALKLLQSA
jgi:DNA-binding NarL/FixJ family response regulator